MDDDALFQRESRKAAIMAQHEPERADYWTGYRRGLLRAYFGEWSGIDANHQLWLTRGADNEASRAMRGVGYRDGLAVLGTV